MWPADDGRDDLEALLAVVRAGTWLRAPRQSKEALHFIAGFIQARPEASRDEVASALRLAGLGPLAWQTARGTLTQPRPLRPLMSQWVQRCRA